MGRALDQAEKRNHKLGNLPVRSWRYVLGILANWRREGGPPAPTTEALPASPSRRPSPGSRPPRRRV